MKKLVVPFECDGEKDEVEVEVPDSDESDEEQIREATHYVQTLIDNGQVATGSNKRGMRVTHEIVKTERGTKRLTRKRFSAI
jgi:hypothetical protein